MGSPQPPRSNSSPEAIFISYRRDDARGASGRVWDWLRIGFGRERVFRDVASIGVGRWRRKIDQALAGSRACVAVIGRRWADHNNLPRLQDSSDMVRYELERALARGEDEELTVVPLLVEEVRLNEIPLQELPESLRPLLGEWNVMALSEGGWDDDTKRLITAIAEATGLSVQPDLEDWLGLMAGAKRGVAAQASSTTQHAATAPPEQLALDDLLRKVAEAPATERPGLRQAFEALSRGDTRLAEAAFEEEVEKSKHLIAAARKLLAVEQRRQAEAARNVACLALIRGDLNKSLRFIEEVLILEPGLPEAHLLLGQVLLARGDIAGAKHAFQQELTRAAAVGELVLEASAHLGLSDCEQARGQGANALHHLDQASKLATELAQQQGEDLQAARTLSVVRIKQGDLELAIGSSSQALANYENGLRLREELVERSPSDHHNKRDLANALERLTQLHLHRSELAAAQSCSRRNLAIREELHAQDPSRLSAESELAIARIKLAETFQAAGQYSDALDNLAQARLTIESLVAIDSTNASWKRQLAYTYRCIGEVQKALDRPADALVFFTNANTIYADLTDSDEENATWQGDHAIVLDRIGELSKAQGDSVSALAAYQDSLAIRKGLVERSPHASPWLRDLFVSQITIADTLSDLGEKTAAIDYARRAFENAERLMDRDSEDPSNRLDRAESCYKLYRLLATLSHTAEGAPDSLLAQAGSIVLELQLQGWPLPEEEWVEELLEQTISAGESILTPRE